MLLLSRRNPVFAFNSRTKGDKMNCYDQWSSVMYRGQPEKNRNRMFHCCMRFALSAFVIIVHLAEATAVGEKARASNFRAC